MVTEHRKADHVSLSHGVTRDAIISVVILEEDSKSNVRAKNEGCRNMSEWIPTVDNELILLSNFRGWMVMTGHLRLQAEHYGFVLQESY